MSEKELLRRLYSCIDNTTLGGTDNEESVGAFCRKVGAEVVDGVRVAAVCVYPRYVEVARKELEATGVKVASVAGAFPHGQLPIELRCNEVRYVVERGADEVDVVISRGLIMGGKEEEARREVAAMKEACGGRTLKVIIESGELVSPTLIYRATRVAIDGGADYVKTSTGKSGIGATPEAAREMLRAVADHRRESGMTVGFKAAGGIREVGEAMTYSAIAAEMMGEEYVRRETFRIGASSLADRIAERLRER